MDTRRKDLGLRTLRGLALFMIFMAASIFIPAGTLAFWQAWALLALFTGLSIGGSYYFLIRDPDLVERRLTGGPAAEAEASQRRIMTAMSFCIVLIMIVPGLDHRFGWSHMPGWLAIAGDLGVALGFLAIFRVFAENTFASARVETAANQKVIDTGPYALVRHPMYSAALLLFGAMPVALGSWWSLLLVIPLIAVLAWRLIDEERVLLRDLPGYAAYREKVRYRLMPGLW